MGVKRTDENGNVKDIIQVLSDAIEAAKKKQKEDNYKDMATIYIGLDATGKTSAIEVKAKAIENKYKKIFDHLEVEFKSNKLGESEFLNSKNDASQKKQSEKNALLLAGINDYKAKESALIAEWDAKIAAAGADSNALSLLNTGKTNALNSLHLEAVKGMGEWTKLFADLDSLSITEIGKLSNSIRQKSKELKLDPVKSTEVLKELDKASAEIRSRNPFASLVESMKQYKNTEDDTFKKNSLKNTFLDSAASLDMVKGSLTTVTSGLKTMGIAGSESTQEILGNITNLLGGASEIATGFATMNPAGILKGTFGVVSSIFGLFDGRSRRANQVIRENAEELKKLKTAYKDLGESMKSALGEDHFKLQLDQMKNLEAQQEKIRKQVDAEKSKSKKKKDKGKIDEWENSSRDLGYQVQDLKKKLMNDLLTTDVGSFAKKIADGIMKGFGEGFADVQGVVNKSVDDLMKSIIARQFEVLVVQKAMVPFEKQAAAAAEDGKFTEQEIKDLSAIGKSAKDVIAGGWKQYEGLLNEMGLGGNNEGAAGSPAATTSGQLQAAMTEETASTLVGLWNSSTLDIRRLKEIAETPRIEPVPVSVYGGEPFDIETYRGLTEEQLQQAKAGAESVRQLLGNSMLIEQNTRRTADNTGMLVTELRSGIGDLKGQLASIERNTKGSKSRG